MPSNSKPQERLGSPFFPDSRMSTLNDRKSLQAEMREKMKKCLGEAVVAKSIEAAASSVPPPPPAPARGTVTNATVKVSPTSATSHRESHGESTVTHPEEGTVTATASNTSHDREHFEAVEIMVVDRGTQTVSSVSVQTDPLPPPIPFLGMGATLSEDGMMRLGNAPGLDYLSHKMRRADTGIDGRPYRFLMDEMEVQDAEGTRCLREQLNLLQNNIEMLISRYNLPPVPDL